MKLEDLGTACRARNADVLADVGLLPRHSSSNPSSISSSASLPTPSPPGTPFSPPPERRKCSAIGHASPPSSLPLRSSIPPPHNFEKKSGQIFLGNRGVNYRSKWEREYHKVLLLSEYPYCEYEPISLNLAKGSRYTPDFVTRDADGNVTCWEVKGFWREAARVRIKVAARLLPWMRFVAVTKTRKKDGGGWKEEIFTP